MIQMNLWKKEKQTHRYRKQTYGYQVGGGVEVVAEMGIRMNWEVGINIYTLLYIKQITNKDLLYSTGHSIQYSVIIYLGK